LRLGVQAKSSWVLRIFLSNRHGQVV